MLWGNKHSVATVAVAALMSFLPVHLAFGHNQVVRTTPADGEEWTVSPVTLEVETLENMLDLGGNSAGFALVVLDKEGLFYGDGCVEIEGNLMRAEAELGPAGEYDVIYQFVSEDGHTISDQFSFVFAPPVGHSPAVGSTQAPVCGEDTAPADSENEDSSPTPTPSTSPSVIAEQQPTVSAEPGVGSVVAGALGIVLVGVAAWWVIALRRKRT